MIHPFFKSKDKNYTLLHGDCIELLNQFDFQFDMIFADPPYFLSNNGTTIQNGQIASVNKGDWDRSHGFKQNNEFNYHWLKACRNKLKRDGTIWISGTYHNIFSVAQMLTILDYKILNCITWAKTNPPPNFSCKYFTHSTEFILWARKSKNVSHLYNYKLMKHMNKGKQMRDIWQLPAIAKWEKSCGKHPTQKPLQLLSRIILSCTQPDAWILDPFTGSSTTGIAANLFGRRFLGIDQDSEYLVISQNRKEEIENKKTFETYLSKLNGLLNLNDIAKCDNNSMLLHDNSSKYLKDLPF